MAFPNISRRGIASGILASHSRLLEYPFLSIYIFIQGIVGPEVLQASKLDGNARVCAIPHYYNLCYHWRGRGWRVMQPRL